MIRNANLNDLNEIAKLHIESYENHFLPKLGPKLLSNYYKEFTDDSNFLVSIDDNNKINRVLLGTSASAIGRNKFIKINKIRLTLQLLWLCLKLDKDTWIRVSRFIWSFLPIKNTKATKITDSNKLSLKVLNILSICVSPDSKGKGVSKALVEEFEERLNKLGYTGYKLTVHKTNSRANRFYKKIGMRIYKESDTAYGYIKQLTK
jgi:ribosomal protein S18 acetylase RimI-like enzyme